eukprot:CAMPEP_0179349620 /NCGR_PEP_ID=MMETSP0797-20121207/74329_1 /TAXON_ID=47934 /ORGANISM="Dinophysis acuminata, Strain DAEP01" /LENGTH=58 /DNA_ID=CAMNT_0021064497 /DNA_START=83 /DNA_END=255 /DNA_ORIENTATION=+
MSSGQPSHQGGPDIGVGTTAAEAAEEAERAAAAAGQPAADTCQTRPMYSSAPSSPLPG